VKKHATDKCEGDEDVGSLKKESQLKDRLKKHLRFVR
jgi:hypothetical protein